MPNKNLPELLPELSLEQKIGQLFLVALIGNTLNDEYREHYLRHKLGNFIYFAHNLTDYKSIRKLSDSLQNTTNESSGIPAFISADQEGGMVIRAYSGTTQFPSNMAITASGMSDSIEQVGEMVGKELRALGINLNHAPVVDVNNNADNPIIGIRSYGDKQELVSKMGVGYVHGLQKSGVMANAKHFPGHGDTNLDSHLDLPTIEHDMNRLNAIEIPPFKAVIANGVDSIMTAHIIFKAIDSEVPATLSHKIMTGFLRGELGFEGLAITDCMTMNAIKDFYTMEKGCVMAIKAGVDILCLCAKLDVQASCYNAVLEAVKSGEIPMARIDEAVARILKYKQKYLVDMKDKDNIQPLEKYPEHEALADEIGRKSITLVKDNKNLLPLAGKKVFIISPAPTRTMVDDERIAKQENFGVKVAAAFSGSGGEFTEISINPDDKEVKAVLDKFNEIDKKEGYDVILFASYNAMLNPGQIRLFEALKATGKQIVVVSLRVPYDILKLQEADCYIAAYEYTNRSINNIIKALLGELEFVGKLPVSNL